MKLHATGPSGVNTITAYGEDYVAVNGQRHRASLIVTPDRVLPWDVSEFTKMTSADFEALKNLEAEIILLGTGRKQRFPHPSLTVSLLEARIGLEVMDVKAACRTYNILIAEERKVAAALLLE